MQFFYYYYGVFYRRVNYFFDGKTDTNSVKHIRTIYISIDMQRNLVGLILHQLKTCLNQINMVLNPVASNCMRCEPHLTKNLSK